LLPIRADPVACALIATIAFAAFLAPPVLMLGLIANAAPRGKKTRNKAARWAPAASSAAPMSFPNPSVAQIGPIKPAGVSPARCSIRVER
jgi:hypothetical protein